MFVAHTPLRLAASIEVPVAQQMITSAKRPTKRIRLNMVAPIFPVQNAVDVEF
jgi:hypothetical protein